MSDEFARDAFCAKCRTFRDVIWTHVEIAEVHVNGQIATFKGLEMRCRVCDFEITKVGRIGPVLQRKPRIVKPEDTSA